MQNLVEFLTQNSLEFKESGEEIILRVCPICGNSKWKFYISCEKIVAHCFRCNIGLGTKELYKSIGYEGSEDSTENNSGLFEVNLDKPTTKKFVPEEQEFPEEFLKLDHEHDYTKKRGLDLETIRHFQLQICFVGEWRNRLIIPVIYKGMVVGWQGRDTTGKAPKKILSSVGFRKSRFLLNYDSVQNCESLIICEGPFDCMKAWRLGSVCVFGKTISDFQVAALLTLSKLKRVYIGLDPDVPDEIEDAANSLSKYFSTYVLKLPPGVKDLGEMNEDEIYGAVEEAICWI